MGNEQIKRLRRVGHNISVIWSIITIGFLVTNTAYVFSQMPSLMAQPRGWAILLLALAFGAWFLRGQVWMAGQRPGNYYRRLMNGELRRLPHRAVIYWLVLLGLALGLGALDNDLYGMLYPVYGTTLGILLMPWALFLTVPTVFAIFVVSGWLPQSFSAGVLLDFFVHVLFFGMYTMIIYLPVILLAGRFRREHVHAELEQSHRELEAAHRQLADAAERERELAVLRERERLARDLHDTIGHALVLASVKLEAALRLRAVDPARADHEIVATQDVLRGTMTELRATLANLRSPDPPREPLTQVLSTRAEEAARRAGWRLTLAVDDDLNVLDPCVYEALLRVGTEALANAEKHAAASAVRVSLGREDDMIVLRVADDGKGIASVRVEQPALVGANGSQMAAPDSPGRGVASSPPGHYGITGMRERVEAVRGTLTIGAGPDGRGTMVEARIAISDH
jgi:signal transduction histidine kinase